MEDSAVGELTSKLFRASNSDDRRHTEAIETIAAWGGRPGDCIFYLSAAEPLIQYFLVTYGWEPKKTASQSVVDLAALLPADNSTVTSGDETYSAKEIMAELGCKSSAFSNYRGKAKIKGGRRDRKFTTTERMGILNVAAKSSDSAIAQNAKRALGATQVAI